jgi:hypothetical protein
MIEPANTKGYRGYDHTLEDIEKSWRAWNAFVKKEQAAGNKNQRELAFLKMWRGFIEQDYQKICAQKG